MPDRSRYFDHAASRPMVRAALATFEEVATKFYGNPSAAHSGGNAARARLQQAKNELCSYCGFDDGRLMLTGGGTEANNLVIRGHMERWLQGRMLIAEDVHPSIWFATDFYPRRTDVLPLGPGGVIDGEVVAGCLHRGTTLVAMSHVCNETGAVHRVREVAELCARKGVQLLCDGAQSLGHVAVDLASIPCDFYTFAAHKFGGPRGVGGVLMREERLRPFLGGGGQEWRLRPGTENVAGLAAAATALQVSLENLPAEQTRLRKLTRYLYHYLGGTISDLLLNSDLESGSPGLLSISVPGLAASASALELDLLGFALATGSACHADQMIPSRAILARGRSEAEALGTLRISMGAETTQEAVFELAVACSEVIKRQRRQAA